MEGSNHENRIIDLENCCLDLWQRAENWKSALEEIKTLTRDRLIINFINNTLTGE